MGRKHYQTVDPPPPPAKERTPRWCPSTNSSLQNSIFEIHQNFNISYFPQFNLSFEKNITFQICPKITPKFTQNRLTVVAKISIKIQRCLKRDREIGRNAMLRDVKTAFTFTPALIKQQVLPTC